MILIFIQQYKTKFSYQANGYTLRILDKWQLIVDYSPLIIMFLSLYKFFKKYSKFLIIASKPGHPNGPTNDRINQCYTKKVLIANNDTICLQPEWHRYRFKCDSGCIATKKKIKTKKKLQHHTLDTSETP